MKYLLVLYRLGKMSLKHNHSQFLLNAGSLAGIPAVHAGHRAGAPHPDHDHRLLRHLQEAHLPVQLQRLPQQVVTGQSQQIRVFKVSFHSHSKA